MQVSKVTSKLPFQAHKSRFSENLEDALNLKANKKLDESLTCDFLDIFNDQHCGEFYIGQGDKKRVYKIDDYYVMSTPKSMFTNNDIPILNVLSRPKNTPIKQISEQLKSYYGTVVTQFGNVKIMKNAVGDKFATEAVYPPQGSFCYEEGYDYFVNKYLPAFSQLPQVAYDNVAYDLKLLNSCKTKEGFVYSFDTNNPRNFLSVGNEIRVVDEIDDKDVLIRYPNNLKKLLNVFFPPDTKFNYKNFGDSDVKNIQEILKKCIIAAENAELGYGNPELADMYDRIFQIAELNVGILDVQNVIKNIEKTKNLEHQEKLDEVLTNLFKNNTRVVEKFTNNNLSYII